MASVQIQGKMDALKKRHPNSIPRSEKISALAARNGPHAMLYLTNGDTYHGDWKNDKKHGDNKSFKGCIFMSEQKLILEPTRQWNLLLQEHRQYL